MRVKEGGKVALRVADEVWVSTALLHREHPDQHDFEAREIKRRAEQERQLHPFVYRSLSSVYQHAIEHCVANRRRNTGRYRMLFATGPTRRRLYRPGDPFHPTREGGKTVPKKDDLPANFRPLLEWYVSEYCAQGSATPGEDPILALYGLGKEIWAGEDADAYVRRLREGW